MLAKHIHILRKNFGKWVTPYILAFYSKNKL